MGNENLEQDQDQDVVDTDVSESEDNGVIIVNSDVEDTYDDDNNSTENADESGEDSENADESGEDSEEDKEPTEEDKKDYAFRRKQAQLKKQREENAALKRELDEKTAKLEKLTAPTRPEVPPIPEVHDPQYDAKVIARDEAIKAATLYDQRVAMGQQEAEKAKEKAFESKVVHLKQLEETYDSNIKKFDLDPTEMQEADEGVVAALGPTKGEVAEFLLSHEQGPLIVRHLYKDTLALDHIADLDPISAAVYIATDIVPKLSSQKNSVKKSKAPKAAKTFNNSRKVKSKDPFLSGAKFYSK